MKNTAFTGSRLPLVEIHFCCFVCLVIVIRKEIWMLGTFFLVLSYTLKIIGWSDYNSTKIWKMVGSIYWKSRCNFIYDKIRFLRWIFWKCINSYRNIFWNADWRTWGSLVHEMLQNIQDFKKAAVSFLIKTQQKRSSRFLLWVCCIQM